MNRFPRGLIDEIPVERPWADFEKKSVVTMTILSNGSDNELNTNTIPVHNFIRFRTKVDFIPKTDEGTDDEDMIYLYNTCLQKLMKSFISPHLL
ncbi:hypothetical protein Ccrd_017985 [Cynara cardunculus var. scolymus]|uniref:Uncharacterized protein n=1 Tax=Cynara cardunculus var. scolymus TaxID=59895 RepID=A0A118K218_CYNCS|nr:hypothetical protein Ccrd_017985 [Cynara cardunculus var. scolymus]